MLELPQEQAKFFELASRYLQLENRKFRWKIISRAILFSLLLIILLIAAFSSEKQTADTDKSHVGLIEISGAIADDSKASADTIATGLRTAFKSKGLKALLLRINSPGGSAVQASYLFHEIRRLEKKHPNIKVYAVCTDACASAAYYIASAANEIYADESSLVGSIGVLYNGFGFVDILNKLGVERRLITSGKLKGMMDPFSPVLPEQKTRLESMLKIIHEQFKHNVKLGRGKRLKATPEIFSGLFWTGAQAKELGLIDGFGSPGSVARDVIKEEKIIDYSKHPNVLERVAKSIGVGASSHLSALFGLNSQTYIR